MLSVGGIIHLKAVYPCHPQISSIEVHHDHSIFVSDYLIFEFIIKCKNSSFIFNKCSFENKMIVYQKHRFKLGQVNP